MAYSGGDLVILTCNHPDLGDFTFDPYAKSDITVNKSGYMSDDDDGSISASGQFIDVLNQTRDSISVTLAGSFGDGTLENLVALQSSLNLGVWAGQSANGHIYRVLGKPVGQLANDGQASKIDVKIAGQNLQII